MRLPLASLAEASTIEDVHFTDGTWNNREVVSGKCRITVHDIRGLACRQ
jgi:hypothetical protein